MRKVRLFFYEIVCNCYFPLILGVLAIILTLFSVQKGFTADDYIHRNVLLYKGSDSFAHTLFNNYIVLQGDYKGLLEIGAFPWWTRDNLTFAFFRPISAVTHWLDYQLWPHSSYAMHIQSVFWYALLCILVAIFYRRFIPWAFVAGLAGLFFTIDVNHLTPIVWLADRNRLIAVFFGVITLIFHDRWRVKKSFFYLFPASFFFLCTLLSAESGVTISSYLIAYAFFLERSKLSKKLLSLGPYVVIVLIWLGVYKYLGFGVVGTGLYIDPTKNPLDFLVQALIRSPVLFSEQWLNISMILPPNMWGFFGPSLYNVLSPFARVLFVFGSVVSSFFFLYILFPLIRKSRIARFWILGMILSIIFSSTTSILNGRLLNFAGIGAFGILAQFIVEVLREENLRKRRVFSLWILFVLIGIHGILSPLQLFWYSAGPNPWQKDIEKLTSIGSGNTLPIRDVVVVNAPSSAYFAWMHPIRMYTGQPIPKQIRILSHGYYDLALTRTGKNTILVQIDNNFNQRLLDKPLHKAYFYKDFDRTIYESPLPITQKARVLNGVLIDVIEYSRDGDPDVVKFSFLKPLEDPSFVWYRWSWEKDKYEPFTLPQVGETIQIAAPI